MLYLAYRKSIELKGRCPLDGMSDANKSTESFKIGFWRRTGGPKRNVLYGRLLSIVSSWYQEVDGTVTDLSKRY